MKIRIPQRRKVLQLLVLLVLDGLFFGMINPNDAFAALIIVAFVLLALTMYAVFDLSLLAISKVMPYPQRLRHRISLGLTVILSLALAMQSIGQLTTRDIMAAVPLVLVLSFYLSYLNIRKDSRKA